MKRSAIILVLLSCLTMSGCLVSSLHPFYKAKDKTYDPRMTGTWMDTDSCLWVIEPNKSAKQFMSPELPDSTFRVVYHEEEGKQSILKGTLFRLNGKRYVDFVPDPDADHCMSDMTGFHHVPVHTLARIEFNRDTLMLFWFGEEWLNDLFEENKIKIKHETVEIGSGYNRHVLTASTEELQKFIIKYASDDKTTAEIESAFTAGKESEDHVFLKLYPHEIKPAKN